VLRRQWGQRRCPPSRTRARRAGSSSPYGRRSCPERWSDVVDEEVPAPPVVPATVVVDAFFPGAVAAVGDDERRLPTGRRPGGGRTVPPRVVVVGVPSSPLGVVVVDGGPTSPYDGEWFAVVEVDALCFGVALAVAGGEGVATTFGPSDGGMRGWKAAAAAPGPGG